MVGECSGVYCFHPDFTVFQCFSLPPVCILVFDLKCLSQSFMSNVSHHFSGRPKTSDFIF